MGWFRQPRFDPEEFERIKQQLAYMRLQFDKAEGTRTELRKRVDTIDGLAEDLAKLGDKLDTAESNSAARVEVAALSAKLDELRARLEVWTKSQHAINDQLTALDQRVTAVSTELANQLTELSGDIEKLASSPSGVTDPAAVADLAVGQARLANEQARYQIAFREDLARLAEELSKRNR